MENEVIDILKVVKSAAVSAGDIINKYRNSTIGVQLKSRANFVTEADLNAEKTIIHALHHIHPDADFWAEETGDQRNGATATWIIDPLDGTTNFVKHLPLTTVSIALVEKGEIVLGVVYDPIHNEMFSAIQGQGAWLNDERITITSEQHLANVLLLHEWGWNLHPEEDAQLMASLMQQVVGIRSLGSCALTLAYTACGRADICWHGRTNPWDMAAGYLLVKEAGGVMYNWEGPLNPLNRSPIIAGPHHLVEQFIDFSHNRTTQMK